MATTKAIIAVLVDRSMSNRYKVLKQDLPVELIEYYEYKESQPANIARNGGLWVEVTEDAVFFRTPSVGGTKCEVKPAQSESTGNWYPQYAEVLTTEQHIAKAEAYRKARAEARPERKVSNPADASF